MSGAHIRANEVQKTIEPVRQPGRELLRQQEQGTAQAVAPQDAYRRVQLNRDAPRPADLLALQRAAGNRSVQRMVAQRQQLRGIIGGAVQLQDGLEDEEPLQNKLVTTQRQTAEKEEEPLQGRFETAQRQGAEDEELQMKAAPAAPVQLEGELPPPPNRTGLPDGLKSAIESLSGISLDSVSVHYNSSQPAQLNALAYTQGGDIHVAPGQERHLPHEAWHVVQQAQGRVQPTMQMKDGVPVNDDAGLEHEADVMGGHAAAGAARAFRQDTRPDPIPTAQPLPIVERAGDINVKIGNDSAVTRRIRSTLKTPGTVQRSTRPDHGALLTKTWYSAQIDSTGIANIIPAVVASMSPGSGVYLGDDPDDWEQWLEVGTNQDVHKLVVPDKEAFSNHPGLLPAFLQNNGQSVEANCEMVAEHEMMHLKHTVTNLNNNTGLGAGTAAQSFDYTHIQGTVDDLKTQVKAASTHKLGQSVLRLEQAKAFIPPRLQYILNVWNSRSTNADAPTVMRELRRYLEEQIKDDDPEAWLAFKARILELDRECSTSIGLKQPKKGWFW
jgi:hypothetical protein